MANWDWEMDVLQTDFWYGRIPMYCTWQTVVIITKGNGGSRGIDIVELLWKALSGVINCWIGLAVKFHDIMHGFRADGGAGTASLKAKVLQKMMAMR